MEEEKFNPFEKDTSEYELFIHGLVDEEGNYTDVGWKHFYMVMERDGEFRKKIVYELKNK